MKARYYIILLLLVFLCVCLTLLIKNNLNKIYVKMDFLTNARNVYKVATKQYEIDKENDHKKISYQKGFSLSTGTDIKGLGLKDSEINYVITFNNKGEINYFKVVDRNDEIELGDLTKNTKVEYHDINELVIKRNEELSNDLFEFVSKEEKSGEYNRGYKLEQIDSDYYITIYLGEVNSKSYFKLDNVIENNKKFLVSVNSFIDKSKGNTITPSIKIRLKKTPDSIIVSDVLNNIEFEQMGDNI